MIVTLPDGPPIRMWSDADDWSTSRTWWRGYRAVEADTVDIWRAHARDADVVLDIGAHVGWYALLAAQAGAGRVIAFEPHPRIAARCGLNVSHNPWPVTVVPYACTDRSGPVTFHIDGPGYPSSSAIDRTDLSYESLRVAATTIDEFVDQWDLPTVDLVKIDVEGHEPNVFAGMQRTLERFHPVVVFEMICNATSGPAIAGVLDPLGYRYFRLTDDGPVPAEGPIAPTDHYCNYLATTATLPV